MLEMGYSNTSLLELNAPYLSQDEQCFAIISRHLRLQIMNHRFSSFLKEEA